MSLLYSSSRGNSEMTGKPARMINSEIASQMSIERDEITTVLISLNIQPINSAFAEKNPPTLQNSLNMLGNGFSTKVELRSNVRHRNPEAENHKTQTKTLQNVF